MSYAYELADALASAEKHLIETGALGKNTTISIAINQIRRQADRIAELEKAKTLTDEDIEHLVKRWFNCHPEATLDEQFTVPLYSVVTLCKGVLKK